MEPPRAKIGAIAFAGIALAVEMLVELPKLIGWTLLLASIFLFAWAIAQESVMRGLARIPLGNHVSRFMLRFDEWFENFTTATPAYDANVAWKLRDLWCRGAQLQDDPDADLYDGVSQWTADVVRFLDDKLPWETVLFETIAHRHATPRHALAARLSKLRLIIGRYELGQLRPRD